MSEGSNLLALLRKSKLARLSVLKLWSETVTMRTAHSPTKRRRSDKRQRRPNAKERTLRTTKHEMALDVVQKLLEQCRAETEPRRCRLESLMEVDGCAAAWMGYSATGCQLACFDES